MVGIRTYRAEAKRTLVLAGPVVASMLAQNSMGFVDTVMVGRLGSLPLAAAALGNNVFFFILLVCMGIILAVEPLVAQAYGSGNHQAIERTVRQGLWLGVLLTIPAFLIVWNITPFLRATGQPDEVIVLTQGYLRAVSFGYLPMLSFTALRSFVEGLARPLPVTVITFMAAGLNAVADYAFIHGEFGMPALGVTGAGIATAMVQWFMFIALGTFIRWDPVLRAYRIFEKLKRPDRSYLGEIFRVGWPVGVSHGLESGLFTVTALLIGSLSTVALAAHQVALQSAAFTFMVPLGIGVATSVRVGQAVGRGDGAAARRAGFVGIMLGLSFMTMTAVLFRTVPDMVVGLYLDLNDPSNMEVARLAAILLGVAGVFQVFDGIQVSAAGALRGLKDTRTPMLIGFVAYWVIGLSVGCLLGFGLGRGAEGLWWGLVVGLASAATMLTLRFRRLSSRIPARATNAVEDLPLPAVAAE